jgi:hypothetical protein
MSSSWDRGLTGRVGVAVSPSARQTPSSSGDSCGHSVSSSRSAAVVALSMSLAADWSSTKLPPVPRSAYTQMTFRANAARRRESRERRRGKYPHSLPGLVPGSHPDRCATRANLRVRTHELPAPLEGVETPAPEVSLGEHLCALASRSESLAIRLARDAACSGRIRILRRHAGGTAEVHGGGFARSRCRRSTMPEGRGVRSPDQTDGCSTVSDGGFVTSRRRAPCPSPRGTARRTRLNGLSIRWRWHTDPRSGPCRSQRSTAPDPRGPQGQPLRRRPGRNVAGRRIDLRPLCS